MMTIRVMIVVTSIGIFMLCRSAVAQDIIQDHHNWDSQIQHFAPVGQTFTAQSSGISTVAIRTQDCNSHFSNEPVEFTLYDGSGTSGSVLAQKSLVMPAGFNGYFDVDVSEASITSGDVYTFRIHTSNPRRCFNENVFSEANAGPDYAGGAVLYEGSVQPARGDATFRVLVDPHADLEAHVEILQSEAANGDTVQVVMTLANVMGNQASDATITLNVDGPALEILDLSPTGIVGSCLEEVCSIDTLDPGNSVSFEADVQLQSSGTLVAGAETGSLMDDLVSGNNQSSASIEVTQQADLATAWTPSSTVDFEHSPFAFELTVSNAGPDATTPLVSTTSDGPLEGLDWTCSGSGGGICASSGSGNLAETLDLPNGASVTFQFSATVADEAPHHAMSFVASVSDTDVPDSDSDNNEATLVVRTGTFTDRFEALP